MVVAIGVDIRAYESICLLAMLERVQDYIIAVDIVPEAVLAGADSVLALSGGHIFEFLDIVAAATIVWVVQ